MNLSFSTTWPKRMGKWAGEPTHSVEKIHNGLVEHEVRDIEGKLAFDFPSAAAYRWTKKTFPDQLVKLCKLHTIRPGNRWKVGDKIHFKIWTGRPYHSKTFQFAPVMEVKSVQEIEVFWINYRWNNVKVIVDDSLYWSTHLEPDYADILRLATNDGFESVEQFFTYFNKPFKGQIISWVEGVEY